MGCPDGLGMLGKHVLSLIQGRDHPSNKFELVIQLLQTNEVIQECSQQLEHHSTKEADHTKTNPKHSTTVG